MLAGCDFVVLRLRGDAKAPEDFVDLGHEGRDLLADGAEIMVFQFLSLRGGGTEEGPAGIDKVLPSGKPVGIDQEILLFRTGIGDDASGSPVPEETEDAYGLVGEIVHRAEKGGLLVEGFVGIRAESRRNIKDSTIIVMDDEGRGRTIPGGVSARLESRPQTAGREGGGIGLSLDEFLAGEFHQHLSLAVRTGEERIVLLRREAVEGLEPVGIVCRPLGKSPFLQAMGDVVCQRGIEILAFPDGLGKLLVDLLGQMAAHLRIIEDVDPEFAFYIDVFLLRHSLAPFWKREENIKLSC